MVVFYNFFLFKLICIAEFCPLLQMANTDSVNVKADVAPRKREVSEHEQQKIDERRQAKASENSVINSQLKELKQERMAQAEARYHYFLYVYMHDTYTTSNDAWRLYYCFGLSRIFV
jgi:hypothetical protein